LTDIASTLEPIPEQYNQTLNPIISEHVPNEPLMLFDIGRESLHKSETVAGNQTLLSNSSVISLIPRPYSGELSRVNQTIVSVASSTVSTVSSPTTPTFNLTSAKNVTDTYSAM
jgi:hypothetical protein